MKIHGIMITNNADFHPADHHAEITASKIIEVGENATPEQVSIVRDIRKQLETILTDHHVAVETTERAALSTDKVGRISSALKADGAACNETVDKIMAAMAQTPYANVFASPGTRHAILEIIHHESRSQMQVHRNAAMKPLQS